MPAGNVRYWVDVNPASSEQDATTALQDGRFQPVKRWPPTYGFANGVYWFALDLRNVDHPDESWLYVVEYALLDHLDLYLHYSDGRDQRFVSGDREPYTARSVDHRHFNFALKLPPGKACRRCCGCKPKARCRYRLPIYFGSCLPRNPPTFATRSRRLLRCADRLAALQPADLRVGS
ncbi:MAG: hypothetical protein IPF83_05555 [Rhodanobacteraceae bacterium]|nr:hypothetical protein [Rhodanobacteraceae bacterium]